MPLVAIAYLASHFLSLLGNGIVAVAFPLVVLQITGSASSMGVISVATAVPAVVVGLAAGVLLDRLNRRDCSAAADLVSAASVAALPVVDAVWGLELWWFVVLGIVGAFGDVPGQTAREVLVASVARESGVAVERLVGVRQTLTSAALVVGPAAAGTLVSLLGATAVFLVTAATSAAAALLTLLVPRSAGRPTAALAPESVWRQLAGGVTTLRRSRFLVATVVLIVGLATVVGGVQGLVLPLHFSIIERPDLLGLVLTVLAVGMLAGAAAYAGLARRVSPSGWLATGLGLMTVGFLVIATLASVPVIFAGAFVVGVSNAVLGSVLGVLQVQHTPDAARGRVLSVQNAVLYVAAPVGVAGAAFVADAASPTVAAFAATGVWALAVAAVLLSGAVRDVRGPVAEPARAARAARAAR
jgi:MFS family permease